MITDSWPTAIRDLRERAHDTVARGAVEVACRQGVVLRRSQARVAGLDEAVLLRLTRNGIWSIPRRGVLCPLPPNPPALEVHPYELRRSPHGMADQVVAAAVALVRPGAHVSHDSAAACHGLPLLHAIERPTLSVVDDDHRVATPDATIRCAGMRPEEVTDWFGAPLLTVERTVGDISRSSGVAAGLVAADAALHDGLTTLDLLSRARESSRYRPGVTAFDRVLELADGRAESPLESLVRLCLIDGGLPAPDLQQWVRTYRGAYRVDMLYAAQRVIVEADGLLKYTADDEKVSPLVAEKLRQEALERAGFEVVRVTWWEVQNEPWTVVARVHRKLAAASH